MSTEAGILVGTIALVGLTAVLVAYTPFGRDVWRHATKATAAVWEAISNANQRWVRFVRGQQLFWTSALVVVSVWLLALASHANDLMARQVGRLEIGLLLVACFASIGALIVAYTLGDVQKAPLTPYPGPAPGAAAVNEPESRTRRITDLRRQIYAKAVGMHKFVAGKDGFYMPGEQVRTLNGLIYRLLGEGEDVSAFAIPAAWISSGSIRNESLESHLEGLIIYLNDTRD